ncbi:MAG: ribosome silencing factor [Rhizobacter sp.]|nr:ribosome silencing factor [Rhizobacter sp.]
MDIRKLQRAIVDGLEDVKAQGIQVFDTEHLSALFERVIIASGTSNRQTKALAASVRDAVKSKGFPVPRTEGEDNGEWIIVDCGSAVVHVMQPAIREYYHLEEIWGGKPVKLKLESGPVKLVKASDEAAPAAKKAAAKKAAPAKKSAPAKAPAAKKVAGKTAAKKAPSKKPVTGKAAVTRVVGVKKATPAAKKTTASKPAAKKVAANKPAAKKAAPKKTSSRA